MAELYTHLLIEYYEGMEINFVSDKFKDINIIVSKYTSTMRFINLYSTRVDENRFEIKRNEFIEELKKMNIYISILFDSISFSRHKIISESIYNLEREFRNLIEIVFNKHGNKKDKLKEQATYKSISKKDKKENREKIVQALENPLDDLDFIQLNQFVRENMVIENDITILHNFDKIFDEFESIAGNTMESREKIDELYNEIKDLKEKVLTKKQRKFSASKLYNHITADIQTEWSHLYKIRNLWAHNNCIITKKEFEEYNRLSTHVLDKIDIEFTLLAFFDDMSQISMHSFESEKKDCRLNIKKIEARGREICKLEFILNENGQSSILEMDNFTYKKFDEWFDVLDIKEFKHYNKNPLFLYNCKELYDVFKEKIKNISVDKIEEISKRYQEDSISYTKIDGNACDMAKDIEENLQEIFS